MAAGRNGELQEGKPFWRGQGRAASAQSLPIPRASGNNQLYKLFAEASSLHSGSRNLYKVYLVTAPQCGQIRNTRRRNHITRTWTDANRALQLLSCFLQPIFHSQQRDRGALHVSYLV